MRVQLTNGDAMKGHGVKGTLNSRYKLSDDHTDDHCDQDCRSQQAIKDTQLVEQS